MRKIFYSNIIVICVAVCFFVIGSAFGSSDDSFSGHYYLKDDPNQTLEVLKTGIDEYKLIPGNNEWYCIGFLNGKYFKGTYRYMEKYDNVTGFAQVELIGNGVINYTTQLSLHPKESKSEAVYIKRTK